jgi:uncharacterized protein
MKKQNSPSNSRRKFITKIATGAGAVGLASFVAPLQSIANQSSESAGGCPVVHFEVGCKDLEKTTAFYTDLFGWSKTSVPYASMLNTNVPGAISGQITSLGHEPHQYVTFYIQVENITETLSKVEKAGGTKLVGPIPLPDKSQFAWFKDPEGNMVALITKAPK